MIDTFVVGAGPAGLTTAYLLAKAGRDVVVIEQDARYVGGISRTVDYKGFLFDIGGHRFFSKSKEVVALWNEILPDDFIDRPRLSRIFYKGKFYAYPLKAFEALRNLGILEAMACLASFAWAKARPIRAPKTFHEWVRNQFGERLFSIFFKTYTEKVWGMPCGEISADWAAQRIKGLSLGSAIVDGLRRSLGLRRAGRPAAKTLIESFRYPRRGPGMMWEAAADKIRGFGGHIVMDCKLDGAAWDETRKLWTIGVLCGDGRRETYVARNLVSSAPVRDLMARLSPTPLSLLHARELKYRDFLTVVLIGRTARELPDNWVYIHDPKVQVGSRAELPLLVAGHDPRPGLDLPRPRIFLLRGRRPLDLSRCRTDRAGEGRNRAYRPDGAGRRGGRLRRAPAQGLPRLRRRLCGPPRDDPPGDRRALSDAAPRRPQRHAQVQQPGSCDDDRHADGRQHPRRRAGLRHVAGERGRRIWRSRPVRRETKR